ncbi:unnamed protein product [Peniophora sp. CBMAI 1063]|nr:unnamed protein product [Peniophora sp. CBMAI 1063]
MADSYEELEAFFDEPARAEIRRHFNSKCVLCKAIVSAQDGHYVPLLSERYTYYICKKSLYTSVFKPYTASNGLFACQRCAHEWLMYTQDQVPLVVLMPCKPLMLYALHVFSLANDDASRSQTLDSIFEDLEKDTTSTPERRSAAPFLHCYQLHPVTGPNDTRDTVCNPTLLIHPSPLRQLSHDDHGWPDTYGSNITRYYVVEHDAEPGSMHAPSRSVPRLGQCRDGATTLWRIPGRSPGLFFGYADTNVILDPGDCELYGVFERLRAHMKHFRGLSADYRPKNQLTSWNVIVQRMEDTGEPPSKTCKDAYGVMLLNDPRSRVY